MQDCNDCYFNDRTDKDLEAGEQCFCKWHGTYARRACSSWVSETSVEIGEEQLNGVDEDLWVSGDPLIDKAIDEQLDDLLRRDHE